MPLNEVRSETQAHSTPMEEGPRPVRVEPEADGDHGGRRATRFTKARAWANELDGDVVLTYTGVAVLVFAFALIALTWGAVAAQTEVWRQLPYIVSGGVTAICLALLGVTLINIASRDRGNRAREREVEQLAALVEQQKSLAALLATTRSPRPRSVRAGGED